ncbi:acyl-CoA N-acyltransferase [Tribonema minus]|uniref:Acyl-CoA N-acyltransferase n=1 Tax=Tribonema minus TaxID=303371 RepID=A0A836CGR4_9STRA|nr:acyl-CoA N-acyltransferase [Tribonema minus]
MLNTRDKLLTGEQLPEPKVEIVYEVYGGEQRLGDIMALVDRDLSEPYNIFTYRYFLNNWPELCFVALAGQDIAGVVVCKAERDQDERYCGYIAMLAVETDYRHHGIGTKLVARAIQAMHKLGCDEVALETEVTNQAALRLYERLGFMREERLMRYYLNGVDAFRLKLWLTG